MGYGIQIVIIIVEQCQYGGPFFILAWDPGISLLYNSITIIVARANFYFHEFGSIVEQFAEGLSKLL